MTDTERKDLSIGKIRKAVEQLKILDGRRKEVKFYKAPIRNWPLFWKLFDAGRMRQTRPGGPWELCD